MNMPFELHIALRYLLAKRKQAFISVISLDLDARRHGRRHGAGHRAGADDRPAERAARPHPRSRTRTSTCATRRHRRLPRRGRPSCAGPARHRRRAGDSRQGLLSASRETAPVSQRHRSGARAAGHRHQEGDAERQPRSALLDAATQLDGILLGKDLAAKLGVGVGDTVTVLTPRGTLSPMGMMPQPTSSGRRHLHASGLYEFDSTYGFVSLDVAERLFDKDSPSSSSCASTTSTWRPQIAQAIPSCSGQRNTSRGLADDEPVALLGAHRSRRWPCRSRSASSSWWRR